MKQNFSINSRVPGVANVSRGALYDFQPYIAAGQLQLAMFQVPAGQGGKTLADTNMTLAGQLPAGKFFQVESIEVYFFPGSPVDIVAATATNTAQQADDTYQVFKSGWLDFQIGDTSFLTDAPLGKFPPATSLRVDQSLAGTFAAPLMVKSEYAVMTGLLYRIQPNLTLEPNQNFNVTLNWPAVVALPSTNAGRIGVNMRGLLKRNAG